MDKKRICVVIIILFFVLIFLLWLFIWLFYSKNNIKNYLNTLESNIVKLDEENKILKKENLTLKQKNNNVQNIWTEEKEEKIIENKKNNNENIVKNIVNTDKKFNKDWFDLDSDDSLQKFVTSTKSFNDKWYIPKNLEKISSEFIFDTKWWNQTLRKEANEALQKMWEKFFEDKNEKIKVVSAYRSYNYQVWIKSRWCPDSLCAKAWFSEHQTWLVVDLWSASSESVWKNDKTLQDYFSWLKQNAHNFGFHNTYQRWIKIDGYVVEPWHWRYLWVKLATYLKENNLTIAEYYKN